MSFFLGNGIVKRAINLTLRIMSVLMIFCLCKHEAMVYDKEVLIVPLFSDDEWVKFLLRKQSLNKNHYVTGTTELLTQKL